MLYVVDGIFKKIQLKRIDIHGCLPVSGSAGNEVLDESPAVEVDLY